MTTNYFCRSRLQPGEVFSQITVGLVSDIVISFNLTNGGPENAYRSVAVIQYSTAFAFSRIEVRRCARVRNTCINSMQH